MGSRAYIEDIRRRAVCETYLRDLGSRLVSPEFETTRASVVELRTSGKTSHTEITTSSQLSSKVQELDISWSAKQVQSPAAQKAARVQLVVVENPSPDFINFLGTYYEVSPEFFADHAAGCTPKKNQVSRLPSQSLRSPFLHANGIQSYRISDLADKAPGFKHDTEIASYLLNRKHYFKRKWCYFTDKKGFHLEDRFSYFVKARGENDWIAICLIDPRLAPRRASEHDGSLRLPSSDDGWQGNQFINTTSTFDDSGFSLHDAFTAYLASDFTLEEFVEDAFSPSIFLYLHLALVWNEQVTRLSSDLQNLSFAPTPQTFNIEVTDRLNEIRSGLHNSSTSIQHICEHLEYRTEASCSESPKRDTWDPWIIRHGTLRSRFQDLHYDFKYLLCRTHELQSLATESINIAIMKRPITQTLEIPAVSETKETIPQYTPTPDQNQAIKNLTRLLAIYLPLILGGILFGMNVQQINSTGPQLAAFLLVAFGLVLITFLALTACKQLESVDFQVRFFRFWDRKWRREKFETGAV